MTDKFQTFINPLSGATEMLTKSGKKRRIDFEIPTWGVKTKMLKTSEQMAFKLGEIFEFVDSNHSAKNLIIVSFTRSSLPNFCALLMESQSFLQSGPER